MIDDSPERPVPKPPAPTSGMSKEDQIKALKKQLEEVERLMEKTEYGTKLFQNTGINI